MEVAGPLGTPLGLAQRKRASPRGEAGTSGFLSVSDSDGRFRTDWFYLLAVQGILKNLLQHHNSKTSIFWCSASFMFQLSHLYITTGKTIALTIGTFVGKVMSLLFNTLSRFGIAFLSRSKRLLNSWLQLPSAVILEPEKIKSVTASTFPPSICSEVMGPDPMILVF